MTAAELTDLLSPERLNACPEARKWADGRTLADAWRDCERGDWLLWLAARAGVRRETVVLAACECARLALPYLPPGELRPLHGIETAEAWARGEALRSATQDAAIDLYLYCATGPFLAAVYAMYCATVAGTDSAALFAASAAFAAADANADSHATSRAATLARCADLVLARISAEDVEGGLKAWVDEHMKSATKRAEMELARLYWGSD